jgi:hypothetical protein
MGLQFPMRQPLEQLRILAVFAINPAYNKSINMNNIDAIITWCIFGLMVYIFSRINQRIEKAEPEPGPENEKEPPI